MKTAEKCLLCDSPNVVLQWKDARGYQVNKCCDCTFLFLDKMPSQQQLERYYSEEYFMASYVRSTKDLITAANNPRIVAEAKEYASIINSYFSPAKRIAEIGCSWGYLLWNLQRLGYQVKGYELSRTTAEAGHQELGIDIIAGFFETQLEQFDVLILRHVLEHVNNPKELLEKIYKSLTPNGLFILEGPNLDSISSRVFGKNVSWVAPPEHVSFPTFKSLTVAGENAGFTCIHKSTRRGRGISIFHQALLNTVGLFFGGKEKAKERLGGINENASTQSLSLAKRTTLNAVGLLDLVCSPVQPLLRQFLLEEEMLIVFQK
jgi:2-polyprenyl-3-methyl-5-hydroxy-6-metoxy-1,4-benzoquinol methylase